jgi:hypothetical protein
VPGANIAWISSIGFSFSQKVRLAIFILKKASLAAALVVSIPVLAAKPGRCDSFFTKSPFSKSQFAAMRAAREHPDYNLRIVNKVIDGNARYAVIVGESHKKRDAEEAIVGLDLLPAFKFQGSEGPEPTIDDKIGRWFKRIISFRFLIRLGDDERNRLVALRRQKIAADPSIRGAFRGSTTYYTEFVSASGTIVVELEKGYKLPLKSQIVNGFWLRAPVAVCAVASSCAFMAASFLVDDIPTIVADRLAAFGSLLGPIALAYVIQSETMQTLLGLPKDPDMVAERNLVMASSIEDSFKTWPAEDVMLVIVGRNHVFDESNPSMTLAEILKRSGWQELRP